MTPILINNVYLYAQWLTRRAHSFAPAWHQGICVIFLRWYLTPMQMSQFLTISGPKVIKKESLLLWNLQGPYQALGIKPEILYHLSFSDALEWGQSPFTKTSAPDKQLYKWVEWRCSKEKIVLNASSWHVMWGTGGRSRRLMSEAQMAPSSALPIASCKVRPIIWPLGFPDCSHLVQQAV